MNTFERYARQIQVDKIGVEGQQVLARSRVLIVGMGGLGCIIAPYLAGAGVGQLVLVDHDEIASSNLHRQILFTEADIGQPKATVAQRELWARNSAINVVAHAERLCPSNAQRLCQDCDLIIDAADNTGVSYLLSDASDALGVPMLSASVNRTFGYLGLFGGNAPSFRALFPRLPRVRTSCETVGVIGPSAGIIASLQAQEAIKALVKQPSLSGRLLYLDLWNYSQHIIDFGSTLENAPVGPQLIQAEDIMADDYIIDVRQPDEIIAAPQVFDITLCQPIDELLISNLSLRSSRIVLACRSGQRAMLAAQYLIDQGHENVAAILPGANSA